MLTPKRWRLNAIIVACGLLLAGSAGWSDAQATPPKTPIKHCKVRPTPGRPGHEACTNNDVDAGGGDASLNPDNHGRPPGNGGTFGTPADQNRCFVNCTHGAGPLDEQACHDTCYGN